MEEYGENILDYDWIPVKNPRSIWLKRLLDATKNGSVVDRLGLVLRPEECNNLQQVDEQKKRSTL